MSKSTSWRVRPGLTIDDVPNRKLNCTPTHRPLNHEGYGNCGVHRFGVKVYQAHRLAWIDHHGRLPKPGMVICHHCDWPPCINPEHLYEGTHQDNARDRQERSKRTECYWGHPYEPGSYYLEHYKLSNTISRKCLICQEMRGAATNARRLKAAQLATEVMTKTG